MLAACRPEPPFNSSFSFSEFYIIFPSHRVIHDIHVTTAVERASYNVLEILVTQMHGEQKNVSLDLIELG
jgi:hypothetical protein